MPSGTDVGSPTSSQMIPYIDIGPSVGLRAEVGRLALMLRAAANLNIARNGYDDGSGTRNDMSLTTFRLELDLSWLVHTNEPRSEVIALQR